ncbi:purple acid phosphatase [Elysia marginata]|uniref:Purple acid phosphatase n=1 Tax=Elysia marginata TaxID=1093978 RepID=A0AAV4HG95_9GAST|nr:purple acid phosphatase [Elysia marginata]
MDTRTSRTLSCITLLVSFYSVQCIVWYEPEQVHIAIGESSDQMIIVWNTVNDTKESKVLYGLKGKLNQTVSGSRTKFVDGGEEKRTQFVHRVVLKGLAPQSEYCIERAVNLWWKRINRESNR